MRFKKLLLIVLILAVVVLGVNAFLTKVDVVKDDSLNWLKEKIKGTKRTKKEA